MVIVFVNYLKPRRYFQINMQIAHPPFKYFSCNKMPVTTVFFKATIENIYPVFEKFHLFDFKLFLTVQCRFEQHHPANQADKKADE